MGAHVEIESPNQKCSTEDWSANEGYENGKLVYRLRNGTMVTMSGNPAHVTIDSPNNECDKSGSTRDTYGNGQYTFHFPDGTKVILYSNKDMISESFKKVFTET